MSLKKSLTILWILVFIPMVPLQIADAQQMINYQGRLCNDLGEPISGEFSLSFSIYNDSIGGVQIWSEMHSSISVDSGQFFVYLGSINPIHDSIFTEGSCWLEIAVESEIISPRTRLTMVPYAFTVGTLSGIEGGIVEGPISLSGKGTFGLGNTNDGENGFVAGAENVVGPFTEPDKDQRQCDGTGNYSTIRGGRLNVVCGEYSVIGGGYRNEIESDYSTIAGGHGNEITAHYGFAVGNNNHVFGAWATSAGGYSNVAEGDYSTIIGGQYNTITPDGDYSYLFGVNSTLTEDSTFMVEIPHVRFGDEANGYEFPRADGPAGQILSTDGEGQLSWANLDLQNNCGWTDDGSVVRLTNSSDHVGIGSSNPIANLHVRRGELDVQVTSLDNDDIVIEDEDAVLGLYSEDDPAVNTGIMLAQVAADDYSYQNQWRIYRTSSSENNQLRFSFHSSGQTQFSDFLTIDGSGSVGIGTTTPSQRLTVDGIPFTTEGYVFPDGSIQTTGAISSQLGDYWMLDGDVLTTDEYYGIARGAVSNLFYGDSIRTLVNLGVHCTSGVSGQTHYHGNIYGGHDNTVKGNYSCVLNGHDNTINSNFSTILGGSDNTLGAEADYCLVYGEGLQIDSSYTTAFLDYGQLIINRDDDNGQDYNPVRVGDPQPGIYNGRAAYLTPGGIWTDATLPKSDFEFIQPKDAEVISNTLNSLESIYRLEYSNGEAHMGPDYATFNSAFLVGPKGEDGRFSGSNISAYDMAGVALAAIRELHEKSERIGELKSRIEKLESMISSLEALEVNQEGE